MALVDTEITIASARDLKNVNWKHGDLCPYAVAWIDDGASPQPLKVTTKVDSHGDANPSWDQKFTVPVPKDRLEHARLILEIYHDKAEDPSKALVGRASLSLLDVVDAGGYDEVQDYTMKLKRPSGRPHGKVEISVRLREKRGAYGAPPAYGQRDWQSAYPGYNPQYPATAQSYAQPYPAQPYPAQPYGSASGYSPYGAPAYGAPPQPYGSYSQPSQPYGSYGAPPPQSNYGPPQDNYYQQTPPPYGQDQTTPAKKGGLGKFGGMGAGLAVGALAGAVGGIALNEFIDHKEDEAAKDQEEEDAERYAELDAARGDDGGYGGGDYDGGYDDDY